VRLIELLRKSGYGEYLQHMLDTEGGS